MAPSLGVEVSPVNMRDTAEMERAIAAFAGSTDGGLLVPGSASGAGRRELIIMHAAQHTTARRLPPSATSSTAGGLASYGPISSTSTDARRATSIASLRAKSQPIYRFRHRQRTNSTINRKTAKQLGSTCRNAVARADEVIE